MAVVWKKLAFHDDITAIPATGILLYPTSSCPSGFTLLTSPAEIDYFEYSNDVAVMGAYVASDESVEEEFTTNDGQVNLHQAAATDMLAQGFQVSNSGYITSISLYVNKLGTITAGKKVWVYIYDDSAGEPGSPISVKSSEYEANDVGAGNEWVNFTFSTPLSLTATTQYWVVVDADYVYSAGDFLRWRCDTNEGYANGTGIDWDTSDWNVRAHDYNFRVYYPSPQCYSEDTIIQQGTYSLKGIAKQTVSLNDTLTRTVDPTIDLSGVNTLYFYIYSSRTGANIKLGIHDSGGTTTEKTHTVAQANTWELVTWDISGVSDANKNVIDSIIVTIVNAADADNIFYLDDFKYSAPSTINSYYLCQKD